MNVGLNSKKPKIPSDFFVATLDCMDEKIFIINPE